MPSTSWYLDLRGERMGGDSNPRCLSAHTLSRRAQSTTLSPIQVLDQYLTISILTPRLTCSSKSDARTRSHSESTSCEIDEKTISVFAKFWSEHASSRRFLGSAPTASEL